jgi:hypothetical protein
MHNILIAISPDFADTNQLPQSNRPAGSVKAMAFARCRKKVENYYRHSELVLTAPQRRSMHAGHAGVAAGGGANRRANHEEQPKAQQSPANLSELHHFLTSSEAVVWFPHACSTTIIKLKPIAIRRISLRCSPISARAI